MTMRVLFVAALMALLGPLHAQAPADPRLDDEVRYWIDSRDEIPVMVTVAGSMREARDLWRLLNRALGSGYGEVIGTPNADRAFLVRVNRFGLLVILSFDQVEAIRMPFEMTFPDGVPSS
jgi:hypothetical protein